jgi:FKBP12-rapamycin complex-associated protein
LVFPIEEDYDKHLDLAKICRKEDFFAKCMNILERLKKYLVNNKNISINLELSLSKCLSENDFAPDSQKAIDNLEYIINNEINTIDDNGLKSKIYCYYAFLNMQKYEKNLSEERVNSIMKCLELSTKYNHNNYKTWHYYAFLNYKYFEVLLSMNNKKKNIYAQNAIIGFTNSVCIGGKTIAKTLQDLLRIIEIWFQVGEDITVIKLIKQSFIKIDIDTWLQVLPQLLARVNTKNELIQESLIEILN